MKKRTLYSCMHKVSTTYCLSSLFLLMTVFASCSSDIDEYVGGGEETPVSFEFLLPDKGNKTRAKESFAANDKIYITATVECTNSATVIRSAVLKYVSGSWQPEGNRMMWPKDAKKAQFVAYYLPKEGNVAINPPTEGNPVTIKLAGLKTTTDDLLMATRSDVQLNGVVMLQFAHTTTKLRFTGLKREAETVTLHSETYAIHNEVCISYSEQEGYKHEFRNDGESDGITLTKATTTGEAYFFLNVEEDKWNGIPFSLTQSGASTETKVSVLDDMSLHKMEKGRAYYISFYSGSTNAGLKAEENWYAESATTKVFDTAEEIKDYFAALGTDGLNEDLDFNNILLDEALISFSPSTRGIGISKSFNGKFHTIRNIYVTNGLFDDIPAGVTVKNLRLENVKVLSTDKDCAGLLAPSNKGTIDSLRISGNSNIGTSGVPYVGGLVGKNFGTISNVEISGTLAMDCYLNTAESGDFCVGGLVGANGVDETGSYTIMNSAITAGSFITVGGSLVAGEASVGGFVGYNAANKTIANCNAHVHIDASYLMALNSHTGGFCGANWGKLEKSEASGDVKGANFTGRSTSGGFVGFTTSSLATVDGCAATGDVSELNVTNGDELYTGGFCGFSAIDLINVSSVGKVLTAANGFTGERKVGALVGVISADKTIFNSFSITLDGTTGLPLAFSGDETCKTRNSHYNGEMLDDDGEGKGQEANAKLLNNAVGGNGYWEWNSSTSVYKGVPYLVKP